MQGGFSSISMLKTDDVVVLHYLMRSLHDDNGRGSNLLFMYFISTEISI